MQELAESYQLSTLCIADLNAMFQFLQHDSENLNKIKAYRTQYGV
jgi:hypothetical protein